MVSTGIPPSLYIAEEGKTSKNMIRVRRIVIKKVYS